MHICFTNCTGLHGATPTPAPLGSTGAPSLTPVGSGLGTVHLLWFPWIKQSELLEKNHYEKCQSLVTCWHLSLMGMMQRASTLASAVDGKTERFCGRGHDQEESSSVFASLHSQLCQGGALLLPQPDQQKSISCVLERVVCWQCAGQSMDFHAVPSCSVSSCLHSQPPREVWQPLSGCILDDRTWWG